MPQVMTALVVSLFAAQVAQEVGTGPEPAPAVVAWEFEFTFLDPKPIEVQLPGSERPETYWYMVYTVKNRGERGQFFFPTFQVVTENLHVFDSDMGIATPVFEAIRERHKLTHPYLAPPTRAIGDLLTGDDNARESVAIWRQIDLSLNSFAVYISGLSGEARFIRNPVYDPTQAETVERGPDGKEVVRNPKHFTLRKTLAIRYNLPGSPGARLLADPERQDMRWIMR